MRLGKSLAALLAVVAALVIGTTGAQAITNGQPDNGAHPYVGLMVALDENGVPLWRCSGSLLSSTVFLTAGHCTTAPADHIEIWFDEGPILTDPVYLAAVQAAAPNPVSCDEVPGVTGYPCVGDVGGTPHLNPDFCNPCAHGASSFASHDVGVVTLGAARTALPTDYAQLPSAGLADTLANKSPVDLVGYGVSVQAQIPGNQLPQPPPFYRWTGPKQRLFAPSEILTGSFKGSDEHLKVALNPGGGSGGTCFGDSGGPILLGDTSTVLGVNSYVNNVNCGGTGYAQRIDLPDILSWIESF
jgi:trypsin